MLPTIELNILTFLIFFGSVQAFILAIVLITSEKFRRKSGYYLALMLVAFGLVNITTGFFLSGAESKFAVLRYTPNFIITLIPASTYFFLRYLITPSYRWRRLDYVIWIVVAIEIIHRLYRYITYLGHGELSEATNLKYFISSNIYESVAMASTLVLIVWAIKKLGKHEKLLYENYSEIEERSLSWLRNCIIAGLAVAFIWMISLFLEIAGNSFNSLAIQIVVLGLTTIICYIGYAMLLRQGFVDSDVFGIVQYDQAADKEDQEPSMSTKAEEHLTRVDQLLSADKIYRDPDLSMTKLADLSGLSNSYLSQILNQLQGQNFFDYVNSFRIDEVKQHIQDPKYAHYTILGIAEEAGFKSKSTFNAVFKKKTGMTPSQYKKTLSTDRQ